MGRPETAILPSGPSGNEEEVLGRGPPFENDHSAMFGLRLLLLWQPG
jgi:hypothetical protein